MNSVSGRGCRGDLEMSVEVAESYWSTGGSCERRDQERGWRSRMTKEEDGGVVVGYRLDVVIYLGSSQV